MKFTIYHAKPVLDLIGKHESRGGDYNIVWGGIKGTHQPPKPLTKMTVAAVLTWQDSIDHLYGSEAAGKYQILEDTLRNIVKQMRFDTSRLFDEAAQDEMACHLLIGRGFQRYLNSTIDTETMAISLAKEWASLPVPHDMQGASRWLKAGQSYYAGDGLNKAHATIKEVEQALWIARERYRSETKPPQPPAPTTPDQNPIKKPASSGVMTAAFLIISAAAAIALLKG